MMAAAAAASSSQQQQPATTAVGVYLDQRNMWVAGDDNKSTRQARGGGRGGWPSKLIAGSRAARIPVTFDFDKR
eukprot:COSAG05_NODE_2048_length_3640_cov_5.415619_3_plen_74_part_00